MNDNTLYDDDILLWSEQQAAVIRKLGETARNLPNDLDIENVAEEIESVGRSEFAAVESYLRQILLHLIKLLADAGSESAPYWRGEIISFHANMKGRYAPSMRQRIDLDEIWRSAREQLLVSSDAAQQQSVADLPAICAFRLDDLIADRIDSFALLEALQVQLGRR